jgi:hypothetical protein
MHAMRPDPNAWRVGSRPGPGAFPTYQLLVPPPPKPPPENPPPKPLPPDDAPPDDDGVAAAIEPVDVVVNDRIACPKRRES